MKKLILFVAIFMAPLVFTNCSNDDDAPADNNSASIVAKWRLTAESYGGVAEDLTDCEKQQTFQFFSNGNADYRVSDEEPCEFFTISMKYEKNSNTLKLIIEDFGTDGGDLTVNANILTLNDTTLKIEFISDSEEGDYAEEDRSTQTFARM